MKVAVVIGTRPEIIKMASIIDALKKEGIDFFLLHTGQHYSYSLDGIFFKQLQLPIPKYNLNIGSDTAGRQIAKMLVGIEDILMKELPNLVLVLGDTNSVVAGALGASKLHIKVGHIEAGLRSYDREMPEEINRILTDHCSDLLFAPTGKAKRILLEEGIGESKVFMTGNTVVDVLYSNLQLLEQPNMVIPEQYILATIHRTENVDVKERFALIVASLKEVCKTFKMPVVYPIHPHAENKVKVYGLDIRGLDIIAPVDYFQSLWLINKAKVVLTDSGGIQEEACILNVPCVTLRDNTERPETLEIGSNILAGIKPERVLECVGTMINKDNHWSNPFGDGKSGERIVRIIKKKL